MNNIILIGMPSCGKSTIGKRLASRLGFAYLDTDDVIKELNGCHLQEIIDRDGVKVFCKREEKAILSVHTDQTVIATGGSAVYSPAAMEHLQSLGTIVYLSISYKMLEQRIGDPRARGVAIPDGFTFFDLYNERVPLYKKYAAITVEETPEDKPDATVERIIKMLDR